VFGVKSSGTRKKKTQPEAKKEEELQVGGLGHRGEAWDGHKPDEGGNTRKKAQTVDKVDKPYVEENAATSTGTGTGFWKILLVCVVLGLAAARFKGRRETRNGSSGSPYLDRYQKNRDD